jgi:arylsulfatase
MADGDGTAIDVHLRRVDAEILVDGERLSGEGDIPHTVPAVIETSGEGLCCGYDSGLPVTRDYRAPFRFTGHIEHVVVEIGESTATDAESLLRAVLTDH